MNRYQYLQFAINNKCYYKRNWFVSCFAITKPDSNVKEYYPGQIKREEWGYSFYNPESSDFIKITDAKPDEPLFTFKDPIKADSSFSMNIEGTIDTTIGRLLFNLICLVPAFGNKYPYINEKANVSVIENIIAKKLKDTPKKEEDRSNVDFHVDEFNKFTDSLQFISSLSMLCVWSATPKSITAPPGIEEFKKGLLEKYKGKLNDPVELAKFEKELLDFDAEYLKGDPADGTFISGKIKNIARKKMFLSLGAEQIYFEERPDVYAITKSLDEGWPTDIQDYVELMNGLRIGSFARGAETVNGGVAAKSLLRAGNNIVIRDIDCGTQLGIHRFFESSEMIQLVGRYVFNGNKVILIENEEIAKEFVNKDIILRSPMFCKLEGQNYCRICAGENLAKYPEGVSIALTEISSIILAASMAAMHGKPLLIAKIELNKAFT